MTPTAWLLAALVVLAVAGCATSGKPDFEQARAMFAARGVQPGQPLPALSLVTLDGKAATVRDTQDGRPLVLLTASLTCNVARRQQPQADELRRRYGDAIAIAIVYTIDAHPKDDACPYTGAEWVPKDNERDNVLVRQPLELAQRLKLARDYQRRFTDSGTTILVDTMDNATWHALGRAPHLGLLIDPEGVVRIRQGWFDAKAMDQALQSMGIQRSAAAVQSANRRRAEDVP